MKGKQLKAMEGSCGFVVGTRQDLGLSFVNSPSDLATYLFHQNQSSNGSRSFGTGAPQKHQQDQKQLKEYYSVLLLLQRLLVLLLLLFLQVLLLSQVLLLPHMYFNRSFYRTEDPD